MKWRKKWRKNPKKFAVYAQYCAQQGAVEEAKMQQELKQKEIERMKEEALQRVEEAEAKGFITSYSYKTTDFCTKPNCVILTNCVILARIVSKILTRLRHFDVCEVRISLYI